MEIENTDTVRPINSAVGMPHVIPTKRSLLKSSVPIIPYTLPPRITPTSSMILELSNKKNLCDISYTPLKTSGLLLSENSMTCGSKPDIGKLKKPWYWLSDSLILLFVEKILLVKVLFMLFVVGNEE